MKRVDIVLSENVAAEGLLHAQVVVADIGELSTAAACRKLMILTKEVPVPFFVTGNITSLGQVQDYLKAGAKRVILGKHQTELYETVNRICGSGRAITKLDEVEERQFAFNWEDLKLNSDGMIPVVVQDYQTNQVLMVAYMNEESFYATLRTGHMVYYSRSRQELWEKGLTSGHYQFVKSMYLDCDNDTILAKVAQIGAACHTGSYSCFFQSLLPAEYPEDEVTK